MKFATSILAIAFIAIPTLAISAEQYERSYEVAEGDAYAREVDELVNSLTREDLNDIFGRDLADDIDRRSPLFGLLFKLGAKVVGAVAHAVQNRKHKRSLEFDEDLEIREPGKLGTAVRVFHSANRAVDRGLRVHDAYQQYRGNSVMYREDMEERELDEEDEMFQREFDEGYFEREFDDLD